MSCPAAPLDGRAALVTGAATGIGRAIASSLAADGARVVVNHLNTPEAAAEVVAGMAEGGKGAVEQFTRILSKDAAVVAFPASADAGWVTGQNIRVNGGTA